MAEEEKKQRTTAKRKFTRLCNRIMEDINNEGELEVIDEKYVTIKLLWDDVQSKHDNYMFAKYPTEEEPSNPTDDEYMRQLEEKFEIIQKAKHDYIRKLKIQEEEEMKFKEKKVVTLDTKVADQKISVEEKLFEQEVKYIDSMLDKDTTGYLKTQISTALKDLKYRLEKCNDALVSYIAAASGEVPVERQKVIDDLHKKYEITNKNCLIYFEKISKKEAERSVKAGIRLERMKLPSFVGDIRNYARFKSDFKRQVEPQTRKEDLAYTLKSCLSGKALEVVECVDDNFVEMWNRLDDKFGRPALLVEVIMNDVHRIPRANEGDNKGLLELVDIVERGYSSLCRVEMEKEMSNSITLSMVEEKLPGAVRREWSKEVNMESSKVDKLDIFPYFLKFLLQQRRILEYEMADLRVETDPFSFTAL